MKDAIGNPGLKPISSILRELFTAQAHEKLNYDSIKIIHSYYVSAINQKAIIKQYLPLSRAHIVEFLSEIVGQDTEALMEKREYLIEPDVKTSRRRGYSDDSQYAL